MIILIEYIIINIVLNVNFSNKWINLFFSIKASSRRIMAAKQFVKDAIAHDHIVLFTKSDCGYCDMVKEVKVEI